MAGNVIRAKGKGKIVNRGKTENAVRPIPLPDWCVTMLDNRHAALGRPAGWADLPEHGRHDPGSQQRPQPGVEPVQGARRVRLDHLPNFRKTVATLLDEAGLTARQIADILGHARPSMTQDVYMGRQRGQPTKAPTPFTAMLGRHPQ